MNSGSGYNVIGTTGSGSILTYTITSLTPGNTYYFEVIAINIVGSGPTSNST